MSMPGMTSEKAPTPTRALVVLPGLPSRSASVNARTLAAAGLARAVGERLGGVDVLTPRGLADVEELESEAVRSSSEPSTGRTVARRLPRAVRQVVGDLRVWRQDRTLGRAAGASADGAYSFVLQFHRRFHRAGARIAERSGVPFVLRVEALEVREEAAWGVRRTGYGRLVEQLGEVRIMRRAALIASVSDVLNDHLEAVGIPDERRVVIPNGVDTNAFSPRAPDLELRHEFGLDGRFAVGWVGGFRPFHGLETVPELARRLRDRFPEAVLCLLGTGPLRDEVSKWTRGLEDVVRLLPAVSHHDVPRWLRVFDACMLLGGMDDFHYSPMKLYEYMACARPVIAPRVGQIAEVFPKGRDDLLVAPGDLDAIVDRIHKLGTNPSLRAESGAQARELVLKDASWDARARSLVDALESRGLLAGSP